MAALTISALMTTEDDELEEFRRRHIGRDSEIDLERLRRVRDILKALHAALVAGDEATWRQIHGFWKLLQRQPAREGDGETPLFAVSGPSPRQSPLPQSPLPPDAAPRARSSSPPSQPAGDPYAPPRQGTGPIRVPALPALPFVSASDDAAEAEDPLRKLPRLTVAGYAALCAACDVFPGRAGDIQRQYGIVDANARQKLDQAWQKRLAENPAQHELWGLLLAQFRQWLETHGTRTSAG